MVSKKFIISALIISFFFIGYIFHNQVTPIIVGVILALATSPIYIRFKSYFTIRYNNGLSSSLLTLVLFLFVFLPLIYFISASYQLIPNIDVKASMQYLQNIVGYLKDLPKPFDILQEPVNAILSDFNVYNVNIDIVQSILNKVAQFFWKINGIIYQFFLILFFYFIFNYYSYKMFSLTTKLLPMSKRFKGNLYSVLRDTISSVFFGTIFSMLIQGISFGLFIYFATDYDALYLGIAAGFFTAIPIIGTYLVAIPLAILEILNQNYLVGFITILFALIVMSGFIDNILRIWFMKFINKKFSLNHSINEFFVLLSMIAGIGVFGGWGIIIAPALLSLSIALINIYLHSKRENLQI